MPIDKMIPRFLVSDEDERLLKEGAMTDALNVSISEDGAGSEGVLKNLKGTAEATLKDGLTQGDIGPSSTVKVIGSVSDPQQNAIYFFVSGGGQQQDAIYKYDTTDDKYLPVIKSSSLLAFTDDMFVKADVINGDFNQDGQTETLLFFTDGVNPPRKINVNRALAGDYPVSGSELAKRAICCAKRPNQFAPTYRFDSDPTFPQNNFKEDLFQFATQNIYVDGEESALSPYSSVAVSQPVTLNALETDGYAVSDILDNVCLINLNANSNEVGIDYVRILCRRGNTGAFFIIDEIKPSEVITRDIFGTPTQVYSPSTGEYRFYNTVLGSFLSERISNKLYDNVPISATGQAITGNRLFYSDYEEGRENVDTDVELDVIYSSFVDKSGSFIAPTANVITQTLTKNIKIDFLAGLSFDSLEEVGSATAQTIVPAGTKIDIGFNFDTSFTLSASNSEPLLSFFATAISGNAVRYGFMESPNSVHFSRTVSSPDPSGFISVSYTVAFDQTITEITSAIADLFVGFQVTYRCDMQTSNTDSTAVLFTGDDEIQELSPFVPDGVDSIEGTLTTPKCLVTVDFNTTTITSNTITIIPRVTAVAVDVPLNGLQFNEADDGYTIALGYGVISESILNDTTLSYSNVNAAYISQEVATAEVIETKPTFKSGSSHSFGIVYKDEFGRSGAVNEIGSAYVETITDRAASTLGLGPASIKLTFNHEPPEWATDYQIVYAGPDSIQDYVQYTTGPAYTAQTRVTSQNDNAKTYIDPENRRLYVSLNTLELYKKEKNPSRDYVFTKGDRLRVISRISDNNSATVYPTATDGSLIEFEVVDLINISHKADSAETTPVNINFGPEHEPDEVRPDEHEGLFIVLESSKINAGLTDSQGNPVRYVGFDWGDVSGFDPSTDGVGGDLERTNATNHWGKGTVVEIYTPKKSTDVKVYYEIGHGNRIGEGRTGNENLHGNTLTLVNGSSWMRPVACKTPLHVDDISEDLWLDTSNSAWENRAAIDTYGYKTLILESSNVTDRFDSEVWSRGRIHLVNKKANTVRRTNSVTYSDIYQEDISVLSLSAFDAAGLNYKNFDPKFGRVSYIGNYNDDMVLLQENKLCLVPVNKNIIEYASGNADVTVSNLVLGQQRYSSGDYGVGNHPESVLIQDNDVFFVDKSRQAVMRLGGGQLVPISQKDVSSLFEDFFNADNDKYVSGYDPRDNTYYITSLGNAPETVSYDIYRGVWQSKCSFTPDVYASQNNMMYSALYVNTSTEEENTDEHYMFWKHDSDVRNTFYGGDTQPSRVTVVSKTSPSRVKVYNAVSYEGDSGDWEMTQAETDLGQVSGSVDSWKTMEGSYYADMPRNTSTGSYGSNTEDIYLGVLTPSGQTNTFNSNIRLSRSNVPSSATGFIGGTEVAISTIDYNANTITFFGFPSELYDQPVTISITMDQTRTTEDVMRGHWSKITLSNSSSSKHELYCINTHISDSKSHHALGG